MRCVSISIISSAHVGAWIWCCDGCCAVQSTKVNKTKKVQTWSGSEKERGWQEAGPSISCGALSPSAPSNHNQVLLVTTATSSHLRDNTSDSTHRHTGAVRIELMILVKFCILTAWMCKDPHPLNIQTFTQLPKGIFKYRC